jgi:hypothetical protein
MGTPMGSLYNTALHHWEWSAKVFRYNSQQRTVAHFGSLPSCSSTIPTHLRLGSFPWSIGYQHSVKASGATPTALESFNRHEHLRRHQNVLL